MTAYPNLTSVPWYKVVVEEGDCLYLPYNWIHHVRTMHAHTHTHTHHTHTYHTHTHHTHTHHTHTTHTPHTHTHTHKTIPSLRFILLAEIWE